MEENRNKHRDMEKTSRLPTLYQLVSLSRQSLEIASWPTSKDVLSRWEWEYTGNGDYLESWTFIWIVSDQYHGQHQGAQDGMGERILMTIISILNYKLTMTWPASLSLWIPPGWRISDTRCTWWLWRPGRGQVTLELITYNFFYNCMTLTYQTSCKIVMLSCHCLFELQIFLTYIWYSIR